MAGQPLDQTEQLFQVMCEQVVRRVTGMCGPVRRIRVASGDLSVEVEWSGPEGAAGGSHAVADTVLPVTNGAVPHLLRAPAEPPRAETGPPPDRTGSELRSPLVGTFYHSPEPGARPFVAVGDVIEPDDQVGIVEAMKLMNPVTAEAGGRVVEILVGDGTAVEYDQPLMVIAPAG